MTVTIHNEHKSMEFDRADWVKQAECAGMATDLWFPQRGASTKEAKAVCAVCPVRQECLDHAMAVPERYGIWGGFSERERRRIRKRRHVAVGSRGSQVAS